MTTISRLKEIFPEISQGYIDANNNNVKDSGEEILKGKVVNETGEVELYFKQDVSAGTAALAKIVYSVKDMPKIEKVLNVLNTEKNEDAVKIKKEYIAIMCANGVERILDHVDIKDAVYDKDGKVIAFNGVFNKDLEFYKGTVSYDDISRILGKEHVFPFFDDIADVGMYDRGRIKQFVNSSDIDGYFNGKAPKAIKEFFSKKDVYTVKAGTTIHMTEGSVFFNVISNKTEESDGMKFRPGKLMLKISANEQVIIAGILAEKYENIPQDSVLESNVLETGVQGSVFRLSKNVVYKWLTLKKGDYVKECLEDGFTLCIRNEAQLKEILPDYHIAYRPGLVLSASAKMISGEEVACFELSLGDGVEVAGYNLKQLELTLLTKGIGKGETITPHSIRFLNKSIEVHAGARAAFFADGDVVLSGTMSEFIEINGARVPGRSITYLKTGNIVKKIAIKLDEDFVFNGEEITKGSIIEYNIIDGDTLNGKTELSRIFYADEFWHIYDELQNAAEKIQRNTASEFRAEAYKIADDAAILMRKRYKDQTISRLGWHDKKSEEKAGVGLSLGYIPTDVKHDDKVLKDLIKLRDELREIEKEENKKQRD